MLLTDNGWCSQPEGLFQNILVELVGNFILIDIEVINALLNYNNVLGWNYMNEMNAITSLVLCVMIFPHNGKIINLEQLMYYKPMPPSNLDNIFPTIRANQHLLSYTKNEPNFFKDSTQIKAYHGAPSQILHIISSPMCTIMLVYDLPHISWEMFIAPSSHESMLCMTIKSHGISTFSP
jgi:hypothetical protein